MKKRLRNIFDQYDVKENHITNSLLVVLNYNKSLLKALLKEYNIPLGSKGINLLSQITPKSSGNRNSIPDGYIYTDDYDLCIGIETKIEFNALREDQLKGHINQLESYKEKYLIVLTPDEKEPLVVAKLRNSFPNIKHISWQSLLKLMTEIGPDNVKNKEGHFLFKEFISYMERNYHMTPFTGFKFTDGYDIDLATHYVKRVSELLSPKIRKIYPRCKHNRPQIKGPWEAWFSSRQVQNSIHPSFSVQPQQLRCNIVLANGCHKEWKKFNEILNDKRESKTFNKYIKDIYKNAATGAESIISFRQRHYLAQTKAVTDAEVIISASEFLGIDKSKPNEIWVNSIKDITNTKNKFNYQLEIGYDIKYEKVGSLASPKSIGIILQAYKNLFPLYKFLTRV
jgi:hypothetical protein